MKNIVDINWLKSHIEDDDLVIIDCRFSLQDPIYGDKAYKEAHIPKAISVNLDKDLAGEKGEHGGRHPLPNMKDFVEFMESLGVSNNTTVLIYDDGDLAAPSRLWWMLKYIGIDKVYLLEGGITAWKTSQGRVTAEEYRGKAKGKIDINFKEEMKCSMDYVKENLRSNDVVIIDSRAKERYLGLVEPMDKKAGHIPGAKNYDWTLNFKEGKVLPLEELKSRFEKVKDYKEVIVHCGSGVTGCANVLILEEIGIPSRLYVGSWSDWSSYDENPVATDGE
ncbi:sulfurtransferase [Clostridium tunisiense]|uniref:sulfurtransferase n=1 Tax=Clostridium tunisiense TaxID=219748 RepID=UPI000304B33B|nr:sulfurtransferase [Clostridium tunisiense]